MSSLISLESQKVCERTFKSSVYMQAPLREREGIKEQGNIYTSSMAALGVCMAMNMTSFTRASAAAAAVLIERKAGGSGDHDQKIRRLPENVRNSRVLIVGGTGVAGRSTAIALSRFCPDIHIVIGARNR